MSIISQWNWEKEIFHFSFTKSIFSSIFFNIVMLIIWSPFFSQLKYLGYLWIYFFIYFFTSINQSCFSVFSYISYFYFVLNSVYKITTETEVDVYFFQEVVPTSSMSQRAERPNTSLCSGIVLVWSTEVCSCGHLTWVTRFL